MATIEITYDPIKGVAVPDGNVEHVYDTVLAKVGEAALADPTLVARISFSTENMIHRFRLGLVRDELPCGLVFRYEDAALTPDRSGGTMPWPEGFADFLEQNEKAIEEALYVRKRREHRR